MAQDGWTLEIFALIAYVHVQVGTALYTQASAYLIHYEYISIGIYKLLQF